MGPLLLVGAPSLAIVFKLPATVTGDCKGTWSLSVTRNRRLTFRIDAAEHEIRDVNLEDYH
jgi:plasmid maintenance system killer protein